MQPHALLRGFAATGRNAVGSWQMLRALPIRWRILSIAALNTVVVIIFAIGIWSSAQVLTSARNDLRQTRESDRLLALLQSQSSDLQNLIHRYFTQPNAALLKEIMDLREVLLGTLKNRASVDPILAGAAEQLLQSTERFVAGFGELRDVQTPLRTPTSTRCSPRRRRCRDSMPSWKTPPRTAPR